MGVHACLYKNGEGLANLVNVHVQLETVWDVIAITTYTPMFKRTLPMLARTSPMLTHTCMQTAKDSESGIATWKVVRVSAWAEMPNSVPNCVRLHHQIDQTFHVFGMKG